jgi:hypothetical protein
MSLVGASQVLAGCDVAFPVVHGPHGEDGTLAALCELAGRPYVGSGVRAGALAMDKQATKRIAAGLGIATARGAVVTSSSAPAPPVGLPVVVKPVAAGSSFGVSRADSAAELERALTAALEFDDRALIEEAVVGREVDIAVVQRPDGSLLVGPPLEIVLDGRALFDTGNKYDGSAQFRVPASLAADDLAQLESAALAMFAALGCAGLARFDFFVTRTRGAERGQHHARHDRAFPGAEDVRCRRAAVPAADRHCYPDSHPGIARRGRPCVTGLIGSQPRAQDNPCGRRRERGSIAEHTRPLSSSLGGHVINAPPRELLIARA